MNRVEMRMQYGMQYIYRRCRESGLMLLAVGSIGFAALAQAEVVVSEPYDADCQEQIGYGPFDYRYIPQEQRDLVENPHFHQHYRAYLQGKALFQLKGRHSSNPIEPPAAGFGYTLMAFPNQPMALAAIEDLSFRSRRDRIRGLPLRVQCYFQRAVHIAPDDGLVRALYGYYYARRNMRKEARHELAKAQELGADDVNAQVYSAFAYLEIGDLDQAERCARAAYADGYQLPGLRMRLEKAGRPLGKIESPVAKEEKAAVPTGDGSSK